MAAKKFKMAAILPQKHVKIAIFLTQNTLKCTYGECFHGYYLNSGLIVNFASRHDIKKYPKWLPKIQNGRHFASKTCQNSNFSYTKHI